MLDNLYLEEVRTIIKRRKDVAIRTAALQAPLLIAKRVVIICRTALPFGIAEIVIAICKITILVWSLMITLMICCVTYGFLLEAAAVKWLHFFSSCVTVQ